ncbi:MAG: hypothetical protein WCV63_08865 [Negativicutes bacterium]|jgi:hypothetical protein
MMNVRIVLLTTLLLIATVCTGGIAAERQAIQFEMENYYYNYSELNLPIRTYGQLKSDESGYVPGFKFSYLYQDLEQHGLDFRLSLSIANSSINYAGTDFNGNPTSGVSTAKFMDAQLLANLYYFKSIELAAYSGVGYHSWDRGVCMANGGSGFMENYSWGYIPVGIRREFFVNSELSIEPDLSYRFMFAGKMAIPSYETTMTLGNKFGVNFQMPIQYRFDETFSGLLTPWIDYSEIGISNAVWSPVKQAYYYEPDSRTWQYGANIGVRVNF